ncbi:hypothetical protein SISSUDRAFT_1054673 [Sistotremastrum suecicum HHB10207 ss-3]|uniref:Glycosyltransferase family 1 protein n=1 Tax=Sistotremastrum suecicum HHB10207 ss-3 TaxID=1314776 RepID=A0A165YB58_9AGAM|nr:hypothetical protein SISSUDRAFT_1054673 [Sistotremastrum suecicum HHB10207 ss-3]
MADSWDVRHNTADLEHVQVRISSSVLELILIIEQVDWFVPVLDLATMPWLVIQGNFQQGRRDYKTFFAHLERSMTADASAWGYTKTLPWQPVPSLHPLVVHLMGNGDEKKLEIPKSLMDTGMVKIWKNLRYGDFYEKIAGVDVVVPAFNPGGGYYTDQASSTVVIAVECNTPVLVSNRVLAAYTYLDPSLTIIRPSALNEVDALKILRTNTLPSSNWSSINAPPSAWTLPATAALPSAGNQEVKDSGIWSAEIPPRERAKELWTEIDALWHGGWRRDERAMERAKRGIWKVGEEFAKRLLQGS